jgi:hypothetical protein
MLVRARASGAPIAAKVAALAESGSAFVFAKNVAPAALDGATAAK